MKNGIHPNYNTDTVVKCACGNTFTTGSTMKEIVTEVCSQCHPFYTGKQKLLDTTGTVDRFRKRLEAAAKAKGVVKDKKPRKTREKK
jgi:large subunit ribosomal protein L31